MSCFAVRRVLQSKLCALVVVGYLLIPGISRAALNASNGEYTSSVLVDWSTGLDEINALTVELRVHRTVGFGLPCSSLLAAGLPASATNFFDTQSVVPGVEYVYSIEIIGSDGSSECSEFDSGYARLSPPLAVTATDGTFPDKVVVTWQPPSLGGLINGYKLYRNKNCTGGILATLPFGTGTYDDTTAVPGVIYDYSLRTVSPLGSSGDSDCSSFDPGHAKINPPRNVAATDGTFPDKVVVTWQPPLPAGDVEGYQLFRGPACDELLAGNLSAGTLSYNDFAVTPGTIYQYTLKTVSPAGLSACSPVDPGHAKILAPTAVSATDGAFPDKVTVSWQAPVGNVTGYDLFRGPNCNSLLIGNLPALPLNFDDTSAIPGVIYQYSMKAHSPAGASECSPMDPGHARISPPQGVSATDGTHPDKVVVTWQPPTTGTITGYDLYRGPNCNTLLQGNLPANATSYNDLAVTPNTSYDYSLKTKSAAGDSVCSSFDPGFAGAVCSNGIDDDGDGYADYPNDPGCSSPTDETETNPDTVCDDGLDNDGDGKIDFKLSGLGDPGCETPTDGDEDDGDAFVSSPAFAKFNTYLGQWNFAELINQGTTNRVVGITVYNLKGQVMIQRGIEVPAGGQVDVDINNLVLVACNILNQGCEGFQDLSALGAPNGSSSPDGYVDTYGFVRFDWDDSNSNEKILGRVSFYRPNKEGSFSFAFAREFRNRTVGTSFGMSNTYDPKGGLDLTPNWVEVINFGSRTANGGIEFTTETYQVNLYNQNGVFRESRLVTLPPLGEFDVHGGHEYLDAFGKVIQGVYLVEVIPLNDKAEYFLSVARYSSNAPRGVDPETYNFALVLDGRVGTLDTLYTAAANVVENVPGLSASPIVDNWVETACVDNSACSVTATFRNRLGAIIGSASSVIPPKGQYHFNASAVFAEKESGSVELVSSGPIIAQSMSYLHGSTGSLLSGFASIAKVKQRASQIGTMNTFLGMENVLSLVSTSNAGHLASYVVRPYGGSPSFGSLDIGAGAASVLGISNNPVINFPVEAYGTFSIETSEEGVLLGEVRRIRLFNKEVDFVMPTVLR